MLVERNNPTEGFKVGDTVLIKASQAVGKIVGFENGRWKVQVGTTQPVLVEQSEISPRQILLG